MKGGWLFWIYEGLMVVLALTVAGLLLLPDEGWARTVNQSIWAVFVLDYVIRFGRATDKRLFFRGNIPDLIAIMPLDFLRLARLARLARLVRLFRAGAVLWRVSKDVRGVLGTNGLGYILGFTGIAVLLAGVGIWATEARIETFGDGIWWSIVTATTVGYGDIAPEGGIGRIIAVILMLVGIGTLGMITGSIATYFIGQSEIKNPNIQYIHSQLEQWEVLSSTERRELAGILNAIAETEINAQGAASEMTS